MTEVEISTSNMAYPPLLSGLDVEGLVERARTAGPTDKILDSQADWQARYTDDSVLQYEWAELSWFEISWGPFLPDPR